ncbi:MAG: GNAT family N-acetyltransferase [Deltaproteobacteria bacterium]|nr:GNAT family N-acetyltransferase [Deltaproteobacteria bacterium]
MLDEYPKDIVLKDGTAVTLRPLQQGDAERLVRFFQRVPAGDRWYLRHDVSDAAVVRSWATGVNYERVIPIIALSDDQIVGDATLHRHRHGGSAHIGEIRLVIDPSARNRRLGTWMVLDLIQLATGLGLEKLVAEIAASEAAAIRALRHLDFVREAVIPDLRKDAHGNADDLVIMVKNLAPAWTDF